MVSAGTCSLLCPVLWDVYVIDNTLGILHTKIVVCVFSCVCGWCHENELWQIWNFRAHAGTVKIITTTRNCKGCTDVERLNYWHLRVRKVLLIVEFHGLTVAIWLNCWYLHILKVLLMPWDSATDSCVFGCVGWVIVTTVLLCNSQELPVCRPCWRHAFFF